VAAKRVNCPNPMMSTLVLKDIPKECLVPRPVTRAAHWIQDHSSQIKSGAQFAARIAFGPLANLYDYLKK